MIRLSLILSLFAMTLVGVGCTSNDAPDSKLGGGGGAGGGGGGGGGGGEPPPPLPPATFNASVIDLINNQTNDTSLPIEIDFDLPDNEEAFPDSLFE